MVHLGIYRAHVSLFWKLVGYCLDLLVSEINLACILDKWDQSFKSIKKFRYLGIQDLSQELLVENRSINVEFLKTKTVEITIGAYLISVVNGVHQIEPGTLITVNNYILGFDLGKWFYLSIWFS